ncbi:MAG: hypothetical protein K0S41_2301 [Anaerocolumna sp.]|jgi:hypothetical protein|nr:hypothetical protein [Anaerocolumna sp.]
MLIIKLGGSNLKIIKNIIKNELYLLAFLVLQEILRILMKAGDYLSVSLKQSVIMIIIVAVLSVIQQVMKETYHKNQNNRKKIN